MFYVCVLVQNFFNISMFLSFVMHLHEDRHMRGRNMQEVYGWYDMLSYTYVHFLVLITIIYINHITVMSAPEPRPHENSCRPSKLMTDLNSTITQVTSYFAPLKLVRGWFVPGERSITNKLHTADPLRSFQTFIYVINSLHFMEPEGSLPFSQETAI